MKYKISFFLLFLVVFYFAQTRIQMQKIGGVYVVPCKVNGLPLNFIFDTGASDVSISLSEAVFMIKNGYISKEDIGAEVYFSIANGDVAKGTKLNIKEIEIEGLKLNNVEASIVHELKAPLLLGQSVIERLGRIQIDKSELLIFSGNNLNFDENSLNIKNTNFDNLNNSDLTGNWELSEVRIYNLSSGVQINNIFDIAENPICLEKSKWNLKDGFSGQIALNNSNCDKIKKKIKWEIKNGEFRFKYDLKNNSFGYALKITDANYHKFELTQTIPTKIDNIFIVYKFKRY